MSDDVQRFPVIEEDARIAKRAVERERVTVRTTAEEKQVVVRDHLTLEEVEVVRVPVDREVAERPATRTEGAVTIIPIVEERLVVEKRLVLVEELHLHRRTRQEDVAVPVTLRRTRVEVAREHIEPQETH